jgi:hypothetical protein
MVCANQYGTAVSELSPSVAAAFGLRLGGGLKSMPQRDSVVLQGRYVVTKGITELLVSVDQKAFKQAMAVREINNLVKGWPSVEGDAVLSVTLGK